VTGEDRGRTFVAIYNGATVASARLIALTMNPEVISAAARQALAELDVTFRTGTASALLDRGRRQALLQIIEAAEADDDDDVDDS
jgi:hypothetical protein